MTRYIMPTTMSNVLETISPPMAKFLKRPRNPINDKIIPKEANDMPHHSYLYRVTHAIMPTINPINPRIFPFLTLGLIVEMSFVDSSI